MPNAPRGGACEETRGNVEDAGEEHVSRVQNLNPKP